MRKLALARVSYRDDFLISYRVYTDDWVISSRSLKVHFMLIKYSEDSTSQTLRMRYPFQSTGRLISHRNVWSFRVYMIPLRDFLPERNSRPGTTTGVNSRRGDSRRQDILWWYHVNKCRAVLSFSFNRSFACSSFVHVAWLDRRFMARHNTDLWNIGQ